MGIPGGIRQGTQTDSRCVSAVLFLKLKDRYPHIYCIVFSIVLCARNISQYFSRRLKSEVAQSCPTLCDSMDCRLPGSSVHGIFQAGILEWAAISFSRRSKERGSSPVTVKELWRVDEHPFFHVYHWSTQEMSSHDLRRRCHANMLRYMEHLPQRKYSCQQCALEHILKIAS